MLTCDSLADRTVLVAEDDVLIGLDLAASLEACGARVIGPIASRRLLDPVAAAADYDLAVFDIHLSDGEVFGAASIAAGRGKPLIFCSGLYPARELARAYPASHFFKKPYDIDALRACIATVAAGVGALRRAA